MLGADQILDRFDENAAVLTNMVNQEKIDLVNLQMVLATSSMNHEYARQAYEKTQSLTRREELLLKMAHLKNLYFAARDKLDFYFPERLEAIERELTFQKLDVLSEHSMN